MPWWCSDGGGGTLPLLAEVPMGVAGRRVGPFGVVDAAACGAGAAGRSAPCPVPSARRQSCKAFPKRLGVHGAKAPERSRDETVGKPVQPHG